MSRTVAIRGHPGYLVSDDGTIFGPTGIKQTPFIDRDGYVIYCLGRKRRTVRASRVLAIAFIPNPSGLPQVNHKDGNKLNNSICNLEWITSKDNTQHSYDTGLHMVGAVLRHDADGSITRYKNAIVAATENDISNPHSIRVAISRGTKSGGYHWTRDSLNAD